MLKRFLSMFVLLCMVLCFSACADKQLKQSNKLVLDYAASITVAEKTVIALEADKLISTNDTRNILKILDRANTAGKQVQEILVGIEQLDPASRSKILAILTVTANELDPYKIQEIVGIKNPDTKASVTTAMVAIRTVITSIMVIAQTGG